MSEANKDDNASEGAPAAQSPSPLSPAAKRALAEAEDRRRQSDAARDVPAERGGRAGPDPVRYGDWENGGIASDF